MATPPENGELETLLEYINERRNFDFRGYKRASLTRRIFKRMQALDVDDYQHYMEMLEVHPDEFADLFNTILINVTAFFRDRGRLGPRWRRRHPADRRAPRARTTRSGCGAPAAPRARRRTRWRCCSPRRSAMERFREPVKIYATDVDDEALARRPAGRYDREARRRRSRRSCASSTSSTRRRVRVFRATCAAR